MSAIRPNKNFDNETKTHTSYTEIVRGQLKSSYENFRAAKQIAPKVKKKKKQTPIEDLPRVDPSAYRKWFSNIIGK